MGVRDTVREALRGLFGSSPSGRVTCPRCGDKLVPLPLYDGDTVQGIRRDLDRDFLYFSCYCGYVFSRQNYKEFLLRARLGWKPALNYPDKDYRGAVLTTFNYKGMDKAKEIAQRLQ